jgi:nicotinamide-nucleotide adenylyltransferase
MSALGCVTGRFQPVHEQHLDLVGRALADCDHVIVAVTNPDPGARRAEAASAHRHMATANPFTYYERARLLDAALRERGWRERTSVVPFDLTRPVLWPHYVPLEARQYVRAYGDWERHKARALQAAGYAVTVLEGDPALKRTAGDIRARMQQGDAGWAALVPASTVALLRQFLDRAPLRSRE